MLKVGLHDPVVEEASPGFPFSSFYGVVGRDQRLRCIASF